MNISKQSIMTVLFPNENRKRFGIVFHNSFCSGKYISLERRLSMTLIHEVNVLENVKTETPK